MKQSDNKLAPTPVPVKEIAVSSTMEVKLTKDDLIQVGLFELEQDIRTELSKCHSERDNLCTQKQELLDKKDEDVKSIILTSLKNVLDPIETALYTLYNVSPTIKINCTLSDFGEIQFHHKYSEIHYSTTRINLLLYKYPKLRAKLEKIFKTAEENFYLITSKINELNKKIQTLESELRGLPYREREIKAAITKRALSTSTEGLQLIQLMKDQIRNNKK